MQLETSVGDPCNMELTVPGTYGGLREEEERLKDAQISALVD